MTIHRRALNDQEAALLGAFRTLPMDWQHVLERAVCALAQESDIDRSEQLQCLLSRPMPGYEDHHRGVYLIREEAGQITGFRVPVIRQEDVRDDSPSSH